MASHSTASQPTKKKRGRGPTTLAWFDKMTPPDNGKWHIEFDPKTGNSEGIWHDVFVSYTSLLVRSKISILIEDWRSVDANSKDRLWQDVTVCITLSSSTYLS